MLVDVEPLTARITLRNAQTDRRNLIFKILFLCLLFRRSLASRPLGSWRHTAECRLCAAGVASGLRIDHPVQIHPSLVTDTLSIQPLHLLNKSISLPTNLRVWGMLTPVMQATRCTRTGRPKEPHPLKRVPVPAFVNDTVPFIWREITNLYM